MLKALFDVLDFVSRVISQSYFKSNSDALSTNENVNAAFVWEVMFDIGTESETDG